MDTRDDDEMTTGSLLLVEMSKEGDNLDGFPET
jgi:hypothetical protein